MPRIERSAVTVGATKISGQSIDDARQIGRAITGLSIATQEFAFRLRATQRGVDYASAVTDIDSAFADLQLNYERDPGLRTVEAAEARHAEDSPRIVQGIVDGIEDEIVQKRVQAYADHRSLRSRIAVNQAAYTKQKAHADVERVRIGDQLLQDYADATDDITRAEIEGQHSTRIRLLSELVGEIAVEDQIRTFAARGHALRVESLLDGDDADVDLALSLLQDKSELRGLPTEKRQEFEQRALAKIRGKQAAELDIRVSRGQSTEQEIRNAESRQIISPSTMANHIKRLDQVQRAQAEAQSGLIRAGMAFTGDGPPLDPNDKNDKSGLDLLYQSWFLPQIEGADGDARADAITNFVTRTGIGMFPKSLQSQVRGGLRSGTDQQAAEAANLIALVNGKDNRALEDFSTKDIGYGLNIAKLVDGGVSPLDAVTYAKEAEQVPETERKELQREFDSEEVSTQIENFIDDLRDPSGIFSIEDRARVLPPLYRGEIRGAAEILFMSNGGDIELALEIAKTGTDRVWALTSVDGGQTRMMKYAPEAVHPEFQGAEFLRQQLLEDVNENAIPELPIERLRLVADLVTARSAPHEYIVEVKQELNEWIPIMENGRLRRFHFDFKTSPEGRRRRAENEKILDTQEKRFAIMESLRESGVVLSPLHRAGR